MNDRSRLRIGILADTHDQVSNIAAVVSYLTERQVGLVIHCGDWVSPFSLEYYKGLPCEMMGVFGNNDADRVRHVRYAAKFGLSATVQADFLVFERFGRRIALYHGEHDAITDALVQCGKYDLVCHGHNHRAVIEQRGGTLSINPGTLVALDQQGFLGPSIALYDPVRHRAALLQLSDLQETSEDPLRQDAIS